MGDLFTMILYEIGLISKGKISKKKGVYRNNVEINKHYIDLNR